MPKLIIIILIICLLSSLSAILGPQPAQTNIKTEGYDPFLGDKYYSYRVYTENPYDYSVFKKYPLNYMPYPYYQIFDRYDPYDDQYGDTPAP